MLVRWLWSLILTFAVFMKLLLMIGRVKMVDIASKFLGNIEDVRSKQVNKNNLTKDNKITFENIEQNLVNCENYRS